MESPAQAHLVAHEILVSVGVKYLELLILLLGHLNVFLFLDYNLLVGILSGVVLGG